MELWWLNRIQQYRRKKWERRLLFQSLYHLSWKKGCVERVADIPDLFLAYICTVSLMYIKKKVIVELFVGFIYYLWWFVNNKQVIHYRRQQEFKIYSIETHYWLIHAYKIKKNRNKKYIHFNVNYRILSLCRKKIIILSGSPCWQRFTDWVKIKIRHVRV